MIELAEGFPEEVLETVLAALEALHSVSDDAPRLTLQLDPDLPQPGRYDVSDDALRIRINPAAVRPHLTLLHELGHYIDHALLGERKRWGTSDERCDRWREAVDDSDSVRDLRQRQAAPELPELARPYGYFLWEEELWARSYVQWVVVRSGDETLLDELTGSLAALAYPEYWGFEDFAPIADRIDELFSEMTWRR